MRNGRADESWERVNDAGNAGRQRAIGREGGREAGFRDRYRVTVTGVRWQIKTCQSNAISVQLDSNFN